MNQTLAVSPTQPTLTWVTVTDARGHERLQQRWIDPASTPKLGIVSAA